MPRGRYHVANRRSEGEATAGEGAEQSMAKLGSGESRDSPPPTTLITISVDPGTSATTEGEEKRESGQYSRTLIIHK